MGGVEGAGSRLDGTESDCEGGLGSARCFGLHASHRAVRHCSVAPGDAECGVAAKGTWLLPSAAVWPWAAAPL